MELCSDYGSSEIFDLWAAIFELYLQYDIGYESNRYSLYHFIIFFLIIPSERDGTIDTREEANRAIYPGHVVRDMD